MAAPVITVGILTGGSNSHTTTSEEVNGVPTDFLSSGVVGSITNTAGVAPATGAFAVNASGSPDANINISTGVAYVSATPTSQNSQRLRVKCTTTGTLAISANASGSTKYDWIYISVSATNAANPAVGADNVATIVASRSSNPTTDDGTPPTYGICIAIVTVANGFSTITNGNITDKRVVSSITQTNYTNYFALYDFIESGCVWTADAAGSTLLASMTPGYVWINGQRLTVQAVTSRAFTASKDTYVDFTDAGNGTATISYNAQTNNAASPALTGLRNAIIVTGASNIAAATSINQGQETMVLPIASSVPYAVTDSLGNLICPRDPQHKTLGYRQIISNSTNTTQADVTGLSCPVIVPTNRKIRIVYDAFSMSINVASGGGSYGFYIMEGATQLANTLVTSLGSGFTSPAHREVQISPSSGLHTYKIQTVGNAGTVTLNASSNSPSIIRVELV